MLVMLAYTCSLVERARAEVVRLRGDQKGVTALEYGIIAAVTVAAIGATIGVVGTDLSAIWTKIGTTMTTAKGS
jgi:pilus assembly protein Flp/PilA